MPGNSIRMPIVMEGSPALGMIQKMQGGLQRLTGAVGKTGVAFIAAGAAIGFFAF